MLRAVRVARAWGMGLDASSTITRGRVSYVWCQPPTRSFTRRGQRQARASLEEVKRSVRPTVSDWAQRSLVLGPGGEETTSSGRHKALPRVDAAEARQMLGRALQEQHPIIITGLQDNWTLATAFDALVQRRGDDLLLQVGVDEDGYRVELGASAFGNYMQHNSDGDDDPLYVLDDSLLDDDEGTTLLAAYQPPRLFTDAARDVPFPGMRVDEQPPMRWLVCGGARSGSALHADPVGAAWNALVRGRKQWLMLPPAADEAAAAATAATLRLDEYDGDRQGMMSWMVDVLPTLSQAELALDLWEGVQHAGETVYVPPGWLHGVINLTTTLAVTENVILRQQPPWSQRTSDDI